MKRRPAKIYDFEKNLKNKRAGRIITVAPKTTIRLEKLQIEGKSFYSNYAKNEINY